jgi:putative tricarboxylic transport membrane protein
MGEIVFHIALLAVLGFFYNDVLSIDTTRVTDVVGAAGFPKAIIVLAFILTAFSMYTAFRSYSKQHALGQTKKLHIEEFNIQFLGVIASIVGFIFASDVIGYLLASIILVAILMALLGQRKPVKIVTISLGTAFIFTMVFGKLLHVPLPRGMGFIQELSFLIY